jgi:hypothetical protein
VAESCHIKAGNEKLQGSATMLYGRDGRFPGLAEKFQDTIVVNMPDPPVNTSSRIDIPQTFAQYVSE